MRTLSSCGGGWKGNQREGVKTRRAEELPTYFYAVLTAEMAATRVPAPGVVNDRSETIKFEFNADKIGVHGRLYIT